MGSGGSPLRFLLALAVLSAGACHDDRAGVRSADIKAGKRRWSEQAELQVGRLAGREALRRLLRWYGLVGGERSRIQALLVGTVDVTSNSDLFRMRRLRGSPGLDDARRRQLRRVISRLMRDRALQPAAGVLDRIADLRHRQPIDVPGREGRLRMPELARLVAATTARKQRLALRARRHATLTQLDRLTRRAVREARQGARGLGLELQRLYDREAERDSAAQLTHAAKLVQQLRRFERAVWRPVATSVAGKPGRASMGDIYFIRAGATMQGQLPSEAALPAVHRLLDRLGLSLRGEGGVSVLCEPGLRTRCVAVSPAEDIRLSHGLSDGVWSLLRLLEEAGRCACATRAGDEAWSDRTLGPRLGGRALGHVLGLVLLERTWLEQHLRGAGRDADPEVIDDLVRFRVLAMVLRLHIDGVARPLVHAVARGAPASGHAQVYSGEIPGAPAALFARVMQQQLGVGLNPRESLEYIAGRGPLDPPALDLRALAAAHMALERLRDTWGASWFEAPDAGKWLAATLCTQPGGGSPARLARSLGAEALDMQAPVRTAARVFAELSTSK